VGSQNHIVQFAQGKWHEWIMRDRRLAPEEVKAGAGDGSILQRADQCPFVN
jgi:hypothetical protein